MKLSQEDLITLYGFLIKDIENTDFDIAMDGLRKYIKSIASVCNIGRIKLTCTVPVNIYTDISEELNFTVYDDKTGGDSFIKKFDYFGNEIIFIVSSYEDSFTEEEKEDIEFVLSIIHSYFVRICNEKYINDSKQFDNITGSPNLFGIISKFQKERIDISKYHCVFINLSGFKAINKKYSLKTGNEIFKEFYEKVLEFFDNKEAFGRLGGDNFLAFVKKEKLDDFLEMLDFLNINFNYKGKNVLIHLNYNAGIYPIKENDDFMQSVNKANIACMTCKNLKEMNVFYYTDEFDARITTEQQILKSFEKAIENEEFLVFYQPKVDAKTKKLCGAEALVRWKKDNRFISPAEFTPILERENLISFLDTYMFEHVCKDIRSFLDEGLEPVKISVNFSRNNLKDKRIFEKIMEFMKKYNIPSKFIEIEITESSMYEDFDELKKLVRSLRNEKIYISVDDFGTGYSSLNFIKDLPFTTIKIDKSFVDSIRENDERNLLFLKNIILLIKGLKMEIVAEGVEEEGQFEYLKENGCDIIQGYFFDKPLCRKDFIKRIENKQY